MCFFSPGIYLHTRVTMTAIESKEEISDTDSGIILHSGKSINKSYMNKTSESHTSFFWYFALSWKHDNTTDVRRASKRKHYIILPIH